jgi:hypothetical protein
MSSLDFLAPIITDDLIRVGNQNDGGYVVPQRAVLSSTALISFGVSTDWSFEQRFLDINPGVVIHAYDHTVSEPLFKHSFHKGLVKFLLGALAFDLLRNRFRLWRAFRAFFGRHATHFQQRISDAHERQLDTTLDEVFARTESGKIFLKIDIEGGEYRIIDDILRHANRIEALVIEFHDTKPLREVFYSAVRRLQERFDVVHLHGNNCGPLAPDGFPDFVEITFTKRREVVRRSRRSSLPVEGLDAPNDAARADYRFHFSTKEADAA